MSRDDDILDYVLGEADFETISALDDLATEDSELAAELEGLLGVVAALETLPEGAWERVDTPALPPLPPLTALPEVERADAGPGAGVAGGDAGGVVVPLRRRVSMPRFAAVAASVALLAAGVGIGAVAFNGGSAAEPAPAGPAIELVSFDQGGPDAAGEVRPLASAEGSLTLDVSGLDPSLPGQIYTLWLIDPDSNLLTLGSFLVPAGGATTVTVPLPVDLEDFWAVDVSIEESNGDPGHSGRSVLRGEIRPASA